MSASLLDDCVLEAARVLSGPSIPVSIGLNLTDVRCHIIRSGYAHNAPARSAHLGRVPGHAGTFAGAGG